MSASEDPLFVVWTETYDDGGRALNHHALSGYALDTGLAAVRSFVGMVHRCRVNDAHRQFQRLAIGTAARRSPKDTAVPLS